MKRIGLLLALGCILPLIGCQAAGSAPPTGITTTSYHSTPAPTPALSPAATATGTPAATAPIETAATADLAQYLPAGEGYRWVYSGFAEYGHEMTLRFIQRCGDVTDYIATGLVYDPSAGESKQDHSLALLYTVQPGVLVQRAVGPMLMDIRYTSVELLREPVQPGAQWAQDVELVDGGRTTLECTITDVQQNADRQNIYVTYRDTATGYVEKRQIATGTGVVAYEKLFITADIPQGDMIGYQLLEGKTGNAQQLKRYLPAENAELDWFGLAEHGQKGMLVQESSNEDAAVYRFDGVYHDGVGTPDAFVVRYRMDYAQGTVTEEVLSNQRTGEKRVNSAITGLQVLKLPLYQGASWTHKAQLNGQDCTVQATILSISDRAAVTVQYVVDNAPDYFENRYIEERVFEPMLGMTSFANLLPGDIDLAPEDAADPAKRRQAIANHMFGYTLRR